MSNFGYFSREQDLIKDLAGAFITIVDGVADYPNINLRTLPMADTARGISPGAGSGIKFRFDFGQDFNVRFWGFLNHNITSGAARIKTYNDAFATPSGEAYFIPYRELDTKFYFKSWTPKRYWEIDFGHCTFNNSFLEMGKVVAGHNITFLSGNYSPGFGRGQRYSAIQNATEFNVIWSYVKQGPINRAGMRFSPAVVATLRTELLAFFHAMQGRGFPVVLIPDNSNSDEVYYMRSTVNILDWQEFYKRALLRGMSFSFEEDSRGRTQTA